MLSTSVPNPSNQSIHEPIRTPLLSPKEVAAYLGMSVGMVRALVHSGELPCSKISARVWRFTPEDLAYLLQHKRVSEIKKSKQKDAVSTPRKANAKAADAVAGLVKEMSQWD